MSKFNDDVKYLCEAAKDLENVTIEKLSQVSNIEKNIARLKTDILNNKDLTSQRTISYILLKNIHTKISLKDIELYMKYIQDKQYDKLQEIIDDNQLFEHIQKQIKNYSKNNPFQNWTAQSIVSHTYYFVKYDNSKIKDIVENIANSFKSMLPNSENFMINANSFYVSRLKSDSWFVLYPKNNKKFNHKKFALLHMSFSNGFITYGLGSGDEFLDNIDEKLQNSKKLEDIQSDTFHEIVAYYKKILPQYTTLNNNALETKSQEKNKNEEEQMPKGSHQKQPLNQILYGPPGTGKTYHTINKALEIIFEKEEKQKEKITYEIEIDKKMEKVQKSYIEVLGLEENERRKHLQGLFEYFKDEKQGQIEFVTFHQSYGYEEFVEGIKALSPDDERNLTDSLIYKVEDGIFKKISDNAKPIKAQPSSLKFDWTRGNVFKMSLGGKNESGILDWCLENNYISMGWGNEIDFSQITAHNWEDFKEKSKPLYQDIKADRFTLQAMYAFKEWMKNGDLVFISLGNLKIVAIGQVVGDYEYKDSIDEIGYSQFRRVKWLFIDKSGIPVEKILNKKLSQQTIYNLDKSYIKKDFFDSLFSENMQSENKNYILIIDEINRGNISKIFGELITLIEESKRIGKEEALHVKLPYSNEPFGVPSNLYIIGTMNTADRSIALMDTALRRRFDFEEMMPRPDLLKKEDDADLEVNGINIKSLLETINKRIEYLYDRDHTIGHAYFMSLKDKNEDEAKAELDNIFKNKIIPLLQEYFYDDWEKIQIVLGDHINQFNSSKQETEKRFYASNEYPECINKYRFIQSIKFKEDDVIGFNHEDIEDEQILYKVSDIFEVLTYKKICDKTESNKIYKEIEEKVKPKIKDENEEKTNSAN